MPKVFMLIATAISLATSSLCFAQDDAPRENAALSYWQAIGLIPTDAHQHYDAIYEALEARDASDPQLIKLVKSSKNALKLMQRGNRIAHCDWGIAYEDGFGALLPHAAKLRLLSRIACLRAIQKFDAMDVDGGIDDLIAVMKVGKHSSADKLLISMLVGIAIENMAIRQFIYFMPRFRKTQLEKLQKKLSQLQFPYSSKQSILFEKKVLLDWTLNILRQPNGKEMLFKKGSVLGQEEFAEISKFSSKKLTEAILNLGTIYDQIAIYCEAHPTICEMREKKLISNLKADPKNNVLPLLFLPSVTPVRRHEAALQIKLAMLNAGIAVILKDKSVLAKKKYHDPIEKQPFEIEEFDGGFVLISDLVHGKKPVSLTFGKRK